MRDLLTVAMILSVGFLTGDLILTHIPHHDDELDWSQQSLSDPAQDGCPGQYHEYAGEFLISCWGNANEGTSEKHLELHRPSDARRSNETSLLLHSSSDAACDRRMACIPRTKLMSNALGPEINWAVLRY